MASSNKKHRISYPNQLFLWLLGYSLLLVGCFAAFQYSREKDFKAEELNSKLQIINSFVLSEMKNGEDVSRIKLKEFEPFRDIRLSVITDSGTVVYDNSLDSLPHSNHLDRKEIHQALKNGEGYTLRRHSASTGDYYFYSATRGDNGVIVRTAVPYSVSLTQLLEADFNFLWIMGLVATVMCIIGYIATRRLGLHITRLSDFAASMEQGVSVSDSQPFPDNDLGAISSHLVRLYARLQQANAERDAQHRDALHQQLEKERIKKQLTNNINHELKTPVASIRICVETLLRHPDMTPQKRELFLNRCLSNTERLQHLLQDVALITRMDDGRESIIKEPLDLSEIIADVIDTRELLARDKGIEIQNSINQDIDIMGNRPMLEAIFNNLIDNAIAYSGASKIFIGISRQNDSRIELGVSDNGSGIPEEHLPHIFERFYRIDKGRSRAAGGTGLGLSIVKNAVLIHNGSIRVENIPSGGLRFLISLELVISE